MKVATFVFQGGLYHPANKEAISACAVLSRMKLRDSDMPWMRSNGYDPRLTNGQEIGKIDITV